MVEVPCTLRCDSCKETAPTVAEAKHVAPGVFVITDNVLPAGWRVAFGQLRCPRCNGVK